VSGSACRPSAHRLVDVGEPSCECGQFRRLGVAAVAERSGELVAKKEEAAGAEQAAAQEVEERFEDDRFADADDPRMTRQLVSACRYFSARESDSGDGEQLLAAPLREPARDGEGLRLA
jgi:hypothetical protein